MERAYTSTQIADIVLRDRNSREVKCLWQNYLHNYDVNMRSMGVWDFLRHRFRRYSNAQIIHEEFDALAVALCDLEILGFDREQIFEIENKLDKVRHRIAWDIKEIVTDQGYDFDQEVTLEAKRNFNGGLYLNIPNESLQAILNLRYPGIDRKMHQYFVEMMGEDACMSVPLDRMDLALFDFGL